MTTSAASTTYGQAVTFSLSVVNTSTSVTPTGGLVTFYLDYGTTSAKSLGSTSLAAGAASLTTRALPAGGHTVTAVYAGTANFAGTLSNADSQSVSPAGTTVSMGSPLAGTVAYGTPVTFAVAVSDPGTGLVPTGLVQFMDGTTVLATVSLNAQGQASISRTPSRGAHAIKAVYLGTANYATAASSTVALTVV